MTKKETIWRHILHETLKKRMQTFTQKNIAEMFGISTSTVWSALKIPRKLGAVEVTGRFFRIRDFEKLLLIWATNRNLQKDIVYQTRVDAPAKRIEGMMPGNVIFGAFSAYRLAHGEAPADYDVIYVYTENSREIEKRFPKNKGSSNLFALKADPGLAAFGKTTPDVQTFVDLWNLPHWYAKDFLESLKKKLL